MTDTLLDDPEEEDENMSYTPCTQICLRIDPNLIERARSLMPTVTITTGRTVRMSDVWRALILTGLEMWEVPAPPAPQKKRKK